MQTRKFFLIETPGSPIHGFSLDIGPKGSIVQIQFQDGRVKSTLIPTQVLLAASQWVQEQDNLEPSQPVSLNKKGLTIVSATKLQVGQTVHIPDQDEFFIVTEVFDGLVLVKGKTTGQLGYIRIDKTE